MNTKLRKALIKMMQSSKVDFFVGEILNKEFVLDNKLPMPTMATDGLKILYTDEWVDKCSMEELIFSITHEFMHIIFKHPDAVKTMNLHPQKANIAMDVVINGMLCKDNIGSAPEGVIKPDYYGTVELDFGKQGKVTVKEAHNKSFLEVYKMLPDFKDDGSGGYGGTIKDGDGEEIRATDDLIPQKLTEEQSQEVDAGVHNIEANGKMKGVGTSFTRKLDELTKGVVPWKNYIRPAVDRAVAGYPTYSKPNRRGHGLGGIIRPSIIREGINVTVAVDTSGSISNRVLSYFLGEIDNLMNSYPKGSVTANCMYHTDEVYRIEKDCKLTKEMLGEIKSGGTCHHEVFEKSEELNSKVLICLTDGYSDYPETTTIGNVIFVCIEKSGSVPAFAKRVDVDSSTWGLSND